MPISLATVMDIFVIVFIAVFAIIGLVKGFLRELVDLGGFLLVIFITLTLAPLLADLLQNLFGVRDLLASVFEGMLSSVSGLDTELSESGIAQKLIEIGIPAFLSEPIAQAAAGLITESGETLACVLAKVLSDYALTFICGAVLILLGRILLKVLAKILTKLIEKLPVIGKLNRLLGGILGFLFGLLYVYILLSILSVLPVAGLQDVLADTVIIHFLYENNVLLLILKSLSIFDYFNGQTTVV